MIEARNLRKTYGSLVAVDDLSFDVRPGVVTGLLGPHGSGKSSTIRLMLGLDSGGGQTRYDGVPYRRLRNPMRHVGTVGDIRAFHPGRRARSHLMMLAASQGIGRARVDEVIEWVGLGEVARQRQGRFSLGMSQRLALGGALLGDPRVLILDEPTDGLDPAGMRWLCGFLRALAAEGRTVLVSGTDLASLARMADHVIVIANGRLVADEPSAVFAGRGDVGELVLIRTPHLERLGRLLAERGAAVARREDHQLAVQGIDRAAVGDLAFRNGIVLHQLSSAVAPAGAAFTGGDTAAPVGHDALFLPHQVTPHRRGSRAGVDLEAEESTQSFEIPGLSTASAGGSATPTGGGLR